MLADHRRWRRSDDGVERRRVVEVEHVLQPARVLIAQRQMRTVGQKTLLDERQYRSVIADHVRDVMRLRERRDHDERHAEPELIEVRAHRGIRRGLLRECRADALGVALAELALGAPPGSKLAGGLDKSSHRPGSIPSGLSAPPCDAAGGAT